MFKKNIATVIAGLIMSGAVYSSNKLGMLKLNSTRHEPFNATITIKHQKGNDLKLMRAQLGTIVDFYRHNLEPSFLNSNLSFKVENKNEQEKIIRITSELPLSTEAFGFVIKLYDDEEKSFGVYNFIPPIVDSMEDVDVFVCNSLNWDKNKKCMQKVNTALGFDENEGENLAKIMLGKTSSNLNILDDNSNLKFKINNSGNNPFIKHDKIKKIQESPATQKEQKLHINKSKAKTANRQDEEKKKLKAQKAVQAQAKKAEADEKKMERAELRRKLKPHMDQAPKKELPAYHSARADNIRDSLKPKISIQKHKEDTISKGVIKFSEILKVEPSGEKK